MKDPKAYIETTVTVETRAREALGICLGASTVSVVRVRQPAPEDPAASPEVISSQTHPHGGDPRKTLQAVLRDSGTDDIDRIVATGRRFREFVNLTTISEPEAVEYAYRHVRPEGIDCPAIVSAGGETFMVYVLDDKGRISNVITGNKCASGTGEFFMQQLQRMGVSLDEAAKWSATETPYQVSGRCSVFCKSDCTHAINKGIPKSRVTAGLCRMMANKILELLNHVEKKNIMITGGSARNQMMIGYLNQAVSGLIVPEQAPYFEALGAALWALENPDAPKPAHDDLFVQGALSFDTLPRLTDFAGQVTFKTMARETIEAGDECILGLDVGSTTTKAVLVRRSDKAMPASVYLYTNGDPVGASRACYRQLLDQVREHVDPSAISITGLGVCGSGRQIAGLHALTDGVINEIVAHAAAAVHFDPEVDTLFEIGGQDAKYTYITSGVPSDYAMNEACSAGTGSFLAESARETLGVEVEQIAEVALTATKPPNFNDQCAAFIASDIKTAVHEGVAHEDIVAGLVYSICMNYTNRVKGNRPVGRKVFMQGGVCYNRAVPLAMAALSSKPIVVPPEPGLMGAFGVALEIEKRIEMGLMQPATFDLQTLADREVVYRKSFTCKGGKEKCDRRCEISVIELEGRRYPFGGACNRYYNLRYNLEYDIASLDLVKKREHLVFDKHAANSDDVVKQRGRVGINKSFLTNTFYPLYSTFFASIGFVPVLASEASEDGCDLRNAAFCYPAELAHGFFHRLITDENPPDYLFLPHVKSIHVPNGDPNSQLCPFVQSEPYYLKTTFRKPLADLENRGTRVLTPFIEMGKGMDAARAPLVETAMSMGVDRATARAAFEKALSRQQACFDEMRQIGKHALEQIEKDPEKIGVVIFARPYNGFVEEAHMGIPHKLASRGVVVIPLDFLPIEAQEAKEHMYWGMGQMILKAARFVKNHPQLFGTYITNFSCGPDSFVVGYFRDIMGRKPSLTLELDSHTADAGIETRIEAFLDIVAEYRQLLLSRAPEQETEAFLPAQTFVENGTPMVRDSSGRVLPLTDSRVTFLVPSMGRLGTELVSAVFEASGFHVAPHPPADENVLKLGRAHTTCKECLPLILTTGTLLNYAYNIKAEDEILVYFMASASGPCRFGQYSVFMQDLVQRLEIPDVAIFSLTSDNSYFGLEQQFNYYKAWWALVISDLMEDIRSMLLANAKDAAHALEIFENRWQAIVEQMKHGNFKQIMAELEKSVDSLSGLPMQKNPADVPVILVTGEIFVRRDGLSRQYITERLAQKGFAVVCSPVSEWIRYSDYCIQTDPANWQQLSLGQKLRFKIRQIFMNRYEKRIFGTLSQTGLVHNPWTDVRTVIENASPYVSPNLGGEAILTVGSALTEVASEACGVIAIGPFGCMPNRISESILSEVMTPGDKLGIPHREKYLETVLDGMESLPFLAVESDGSPFPQLIEAKLEAFCLRARRLHDRMRALN
ncbi:putative CoA-substrate-specific enzyme activase [Desulfosalsimonas propionicica]|uniref:Putative CoA-substrate-specific enzyme activase n=1 Tax=Desulfosalsimonas propionicica TaxID=332175 RepID=A0A7W0HK46_9BACT|nr:acyl-CoA dehydratase activase [Desulfosalsimonas propionicica]MBA2880701.1 putative CoA-substrate-specific enzyme activase [Desulfosalsimonas propionicica]